VQVESTLKFKEFVENFFKLSTRKVLIIVGSNHFNISGLPSVSAIKPDIPENFESLNILCVGRSLIKTIKLKLEESSSWKFATIFEIGSEQAGKNFFRNFDFISLFNSNSKKKFDHYITDTTNFGNRDSTNIPIEIDRKTMETSNNKKFRSNVKPECEIKIFGICIEHFIITYEISKCYNTRVRYFSQEAFIQFRFISDALEYIKSGYIVIQNVAYEFDILKKK